MFRRLAVNKYYKKLYPYLVNRYGKSDCYSVGQIRVTIEECGFSKKYTPFALALFLEKESLAEALNYDETNGGYSSNELREYIANRFFKGDVNYTYKESLCSIVGNSSHTSLSIDVD